MEVILSEAAVDHASRHGGHIYVQAHTHRCCSGALTLADVTTTPPTDPSGYRPFEVDGIAVCYLGDEVGAPQQLSIDVRGLRRRLVAFWDGCAYRM
jgi:hypothetical protein